MSDELSRLKVWWAGLSPDVAYCAGNVEFAKDVLALMQRCERAEVRVKELEEEVSDFQQSSDLQHTRFIEAVTFWQQQTGKHDTWPDLGALLGWLMQRVLRGEGGGDG